MIERIVKVNKMLAPHEAALFAQRAERYPNTQVRLAKIGEEENGFVEGKSVMSILCLCVLKGDEVKLQVCGENEEEVMKVLVDFLIE